MNYMRDMDDGAEMFLAPGFIQFHSHGFYVNISFERMRQQIDVRVRATMPADNNNSFKMCKCLKIHFQWTIDGHKYKIRYSHEPRSIWLMSKGYAIVK